MKANRILAAICGMAAVIAAVSCEKTVNNHDELRGTKVISVPDLNFNLGYGADTISFSFEANCYWGLDLLTWSDIERFEGDTAQVMTTAKWMTAKRLYGSGNAEATVYVNANNSSNKSRTGYIKVFTGDVNVCKILKVVQAGNPNYTPPVRKPFDLTFDFTKNTMNWPTVAQSVGEYTYPLGGVEYSFYLGRCNVSSYLVIHNAGAYLGLPAIEGFKLTRVTAVTSSNNVRERGALVAADEAGSDVVGENQTWPATGKTPIVYDLIGTKYNTRYYLICTLLGLPTDSVILHYEP